MAEQDVSAEVYNDFIQGVNLETIYLAGAVVRLNRFPEGINLGFGVESEAKGPVELPAEAGTSGFQGSIRYKLSLYDQPRSDDAPPAESFAEIEAIWVAVYASQRIPTESEFAVFSAQSLPLNLWPYFRQFAQQTISQMGLPPLTLPTFKA